MELGSGEGGEGRGGGATSLSCALGREVEVVLKMEKRLAEHISVLDGCRESGAWCLLGMMGKILYY